MSSKHFWKTHEPIWDTVCGINTLTSCVQQLNKPSSIEVKVEGRLISISDWQFWNACPPIDWTVDGISIFKSLMHPLKAHSPIDWRDDGNEILASDLHSLNANLPIDWRDDWIFTSCKQTQPSKAKSRITVTDYGIVISLRIEHLQKTWSLIDVIRGGSNFSNEVHSLNAIRSIDSTVDGIIISTKLRQPKKRSSIQRKNLH